MGSLHAYTVVSRCDPLNMHTYWRHAPLLQSVLLDSLHASAPPHESRVAHVVFARRPPTSAQQMSPSGQSPELVHSGPCSPESNGVMPVSLPASSAAASSPSL